MYSESDDSVNPVIKKSIKSDNKNGHLVAPESKLFTSRPASSLHVGRRRQTPLSSHGMIDDSSDNFATDISLDSPTTSRSSMDTSQLDAQYISDGEAFIRNRRNQARERGNRSRSAIEFDSDLNKKVNAVLSSKDTWRNTIANLVNYQPQGMILSVDDNKSIEFFTRCSICKIRGNQDDAKSKNMDETTSTSKVNESDDGDNLEDRFASIKNLFASTEENIDCCQWQESFFRSKKEIQDQEKVLITSGLDKIWQKNIFYHSHQQEEEDENFDCEKDAIYLKSIPKNLPEKSIIKLNERLYRDSGKKWFLSEYIYFVFNSLNKYFTNWSNLIHSVVSDSRNDNLYDYLPIMSRNDLARFQPKVIHAIHELIIHVYCLKFLSNPLMTEEHVAASKLIDSYDEYKIFLSLKSQEKLKKEIDLIKANIDNALASKDLDKNNKQTHLMESKIIVYRKQLAEAHDKWTNTLKKWRLIQLSMLSHWKEVQQKRRNQQFVSTTVRLSYTELIDDTHREEEKKEWLQNVEERFNFERIIRKERQEKALNEYRKQLRIWKHYQKQSKNCNSEQPQLVHDNQDDSNDSNDDDNERMINIDGQVVIKPNPPKLILNEAELLEIIKDATFLSDGRLPGESKFVDFQLHFDTSISSDKECPSSERKRRLMVQQSKYYIEFNCNNSTVKTCESNVDENFQINWQQKVSILLDQPPTEIKCSLFDKAKKKSNLLSLSNLKMPTQINIVPGDEELEREILRLPSNSDQISFDGKIEYIAYWMEDNFHNLKVPDKIMMGEEAIKLRQKMSRTDYEKLASILDGNDVEMYQTSKNYSSRKHVTFLGGSLRDDLDASNIINHIDAFKFVDKNELENNLRFHMLKCRAKGDALLKCLPVPLSEREVSKSLIVLQDESEELADKSHKGIEVKRSKAVAILTKVRRKLLNQAENPLDRSRTWEDLIGEQESLGLKMSFHLLLPTLKRRPLNPSRKERKKVTSIGNNVEVKLIVTVMHGLNVPIRTEIGNKLTKLDAENVGISYESRVNPFVEVVFQRQTARTSRADGASPTWNETLSLKLKVANDDYSPSNLTGITDMIYLNLYDEITIDNNDSTIDDTNSISQRFERHWLGSIKIPFSTLYFNSKIEGVFRLNTPPVLFGYECDSNIFPIGQSISSDSSSNTYLTLFLTIDPSLQVPEQYVIKCDSIESEKVLQHAKQWEIRRKQEFTDRPVRALAVDLNAQFVLVTRYIRPIKPPDELIGNLIHIDKAICRLARFVSLIPSIPDNIALPGLGDIWCSCSQFLEMLLGDSEEHAILLCNFFLYLGKRAAIIIGQGIPEGSTAYVIVWEFVGEEPTLWNPVSGERYNIRDSHIPLHTVGTIFTNDNVYVNIQKQVHPNRLTFNLYESKSWRSLFNRKFPNPGLSSVQNDIDFESTDKNYVDELQIELDKHLRKSLMKWRKRSRTFFNRVAIQQISKILPTFEKKLGKIRHNDLVQDLREILTIHKMIGFPLNMPYTTIDAVTEAVYATGVHFIDEKDVTFALAVYLHPYPCNVISVWIYIAALLRAD